MDKIKDDLDLWEKLIPQVDGERGYDAGEDAEEVGLEGTDAAIGGIAVMEIRGHELESGSPLFCDGAAVFLAVLVVDDLVFNGVAKFLENGHDAVVRRNAVLVIMGLEGLDE